jgi:AbrB family looped-hinge helix DNA binding protein
VTIAKISNKGQITLPAAIRRTLRLKAQSQVTVEVRDDEIVLRPLKSILDLEGIFHAYARPGKPSWEEERREMERAVAEHVAGE